MTRPRRTRENASGENQPPSRAPSSGSPRRGLAAALVVLLAVALFLVARAVWSPVAAPSQAQYVGSERCSSCHQDQYDKWQGSNHALAMQTAHESSVLGDFDNATFPHRGKTWRFYRRDGRFFTEAEGSDGQLHEYEVTHTFGVRPLQQYLVPFPGGRLQTLSAAWDTEQKRWFFVVPGRDDIAPDDWLHWTRPGQNWNTMCADCHSTNVQKGYDVATDTFRTTSSEISVGCEACHGPASEHVAWAEQPAASRIEAENAALSTRTSGLSGQQLVDRCMPCHSRRAQFADQGPPGGEPLDRYLPVLLTERLFHADGQILEEDFEYHAFAQSRMYAKGVSCSDCHDVHSGRRYKSDNTLCTRCHRPEKYDATTHHFHKPLVNGRPNRGASCVSCHMPGQYYMVVHYRHDHSLRVPRPDLSEQIGVPNACNAAGCHADKPARWASDQVRQWHGTSPQPHYGTLLAAGRRRETGAEAGLRSLVADPERTAIVRATALDLLGNYASADTAATIESALADPDPLVRRTAVARLSVADAGQLAARLAPLLDDPVAAVRTETAARLAEVPVSSVAEARRPELDQALQEYIAAQHYMSDMPSGPYNLANLALSRGDTTEAERLYRRSLAIDAQNVPAQVNLATLLAGRGRQAEAEALLQDAFRAEPQEPAIALNLGLLLAEMGRTAEAERALRAALAADPQMAQAAYNLGALIGERSPREAADLCARAANARPDEPRYRWSQAFYLSRAGDLQGAVATLESLLPKHPGYGDAYLLLGELYLRQGRAAEARALYAQGAQESRLPAEVRAGLARLAAGAPAAPRR